MSSVLAEHKRPLDAAVDANPATAAAEVAVVYDVGEAIGARLEVIAHEYHEAVRCVAQLLSQNVCHLVRVLYLFRVI